MRVIANRPGARVSGIFLLLFFFLTVLMAVGWFVVRTDRCRHLLSDRLSDRLGAEVTIGESRVGWPYQLVLRDVVSSGFAAAGTPGFSIGELKLGWWMTWRLELRHVTVRVQQDASGIWTPIVAARLADLRQASAVDIVRLTAPLRRKICLKIADGTMIWLDKEGAEEASLRDVRFRMEPVKLPEQRRMTYYGLKIYAAAGGALGNVRDLQWGWLTSAEQEYIELVRSVRLESGFGTPQALESKTEAVNAE